MEEIKFKSLNELYNRLLPALVSKKKSLHKDGFNYIHEEDVWNCCKDVIWNKSQNLGLYNMVDDILNTDNCVFDEYLKEIIKTNHRDITEDEVE